MNRENESGLIYFPQRSKAEYLMLIFYHGFLLVLYYCTYKLEKNQADRCITEHLKIVLSSLRGEGR